MNDKYFNRNRMMGYILKTISPSSKNPRKIGAGRGRLLQKWGILIVMIFTMLSNKAICQNIEVSRKKNSFLIGGASSLMLNGMYSFDYERNVYKIGKFETLLRIGFGEWYFMDHGVFSNIINGNSINTSINGLFGESSHKFEFNLGVRYVFLEEWEKERISQYLPILNIGYRYQNPFGKGLIFRAYVGDTGLGIAVGKAF